MLKDIERLHADAIEGMRAQGLLVEITRRILAAEDNGERMRITHDFLRESLLLPEFESVSGSVQSKSAESSEVSRLEGNKYFGQEQYRKSLKLYTDAVVKAPLMSRQLALAYSNRSAALYCIGEFHGCLVDLERALDIGCDDTVKQKLIKRRAACESADGKPTRQADLAKVGKVRAWLFAPPEPAHPDWSGVSADVRVERTAEWGRRVVATRRFRPGEVISLERPYMTMLRAKRFHERCYECLEPCRYMLPCDSCVHVMYCSQTCKETSLNRGHKYECPLMSVLIKMLFTNIELLSLRTVIRAFCDHGGSWERLRIESDEADRDPDAQFAGYRAVHTLETNEKKRDPSDFFCKATTAAVFFHLLEKHTEIFESVNSSERNGILEFVGGLLLRHIMTSASNMHTFTAIVESPSGEMIIDDDYAGGALPFMSMLNHSCTPNVCRVTVGESMALLVLRPIASGGQLFDNYGQHHAMKPYAERQKELRFQYKFDCRCEACSDRWPTYLNLLSVNPKGRCPSYKDIIDMNLIEKLQKGNLSAAASVLKKLYENAIVLERFAPCKELADCQETIKQCWNLFGNVEYYN